MLDNSPPPTKRMKLQKKPYSHPNKENHDPNSIPMGGKIKGQDTRKRKVPIRRPIERNLVDLDDYAMLQVLDYLSLEGKFFIIVHGLRDCCEWCIIFWCHSRSVQFGPNKCSYATPRPTLNSIPSKQQRSSIEQR